jgi:hypothetical protein
MLVHHASHYTRRQDKAGKWSADVKGATRAVSAAWPPGNQHAGTHQRVAVAGQAIVVEAAEGHRDVKGASQGTQGLLVLGHTHGAKPRVVERQAGEGGPHKSHTHTTQHKGNASRIHTCPTHTSHG